MTTAKILEINREDDTVIVTFVVNIDGVETRLNLKGVGLTDQNIRNQIRSKVKELENTVTLTNTPLVADVDLTPIAPVVQTQAEIDLQNWLTLYSKWQRVKRAIDVGILTGNETPVQNLLASVKAGFKASYLDFI